MGKYQFIGLGFLLVVTFVMVESAYGSTLFTNDIGGATGTDGVSNLFWSTNDAVQSRFGETFYENSTKKMHTVWWDDTTPNDLVFYSSSTDGITKTTPILIYTGGGGGFPTVGAVEVFASGNTVFVSWLVETSAGVFDMFEKTSTDGGATFSVQWTVFSGAIGINEQSSQELIGNSLNDVVIVYRNSTSDTLEARVSHNNGVTWTFETLAGDNHGTGNADGFHNFADHSITMIGNEINIAFTADFTDATCVTTCDVPFFQQSTDAGDTWLANPLLLTGGLTDISNNEPFLFTSGSTINIFYWDHLHASSNHEQARSTNGGTSFAQEITTGLFGGGCGDTNPYENWIAIGADSNFALFCNDGNSVDFVTSSNTGSTWSSNQNFNTLGDTPDFFQGYTNGTHGVLAYHGDPLGEKHIVFSVNGLATWYEKSDAFTDNENSVIVPNGNLGITDDRVMLVVEDSAFTDEVFSFSFEYPVCLTDPTFNCPFDMAGNTIITDEPTNVAGVGTTTGFHAIFQQNGGGGNPRVYYVTSTDAESASTPLEISGAVLDSTLGVIQADMHIFEDGAGTIDAFWIEDHPTNNQAFHARSTNGGTSFGTKVSINSGNVNINIIAPFVDGTDLGVAYVNGTLPNTVPFYVGSGNGGGTWGSAVDIEGGADECDRAQPTLGQIQLTKSETAGFGILYSAWKGDNQTSSTIGVCFNRSTDGGATWSTVVQNLEDTVADTSSVQPFELFSSGANDVTVVWVNNGEDKVRQSRSTDGGASFGVEEELLSTTAGGNAEACTDPSTVSEVIQDGSSIYAFCGGTNLTGVIKSTDMGATLSSLQTVATTFSRDWDAIAFGERIVVVAQDGSSPKVGNIVFTSADTGATWSETETIFQNFINHDVITGNATNIYLGFADETFFDNVIGTLSASNPYVSMGIFAPLAVPNTTPVITILGDNPLEHLINTTYTDAGATCSDVEDGDLTSSIVTVSTVNSAVVGSYTVTYTCTDSGSLFDQEIRNVSVVTTISAPSGGGATTGGGSPVGDVPEVGFDQAEFDEALADALAQIELTEATPLEVLIQTFFEFTVIDVVHNDIQLQSLLDNERLGFRWSSGSNLVLVSAIPAPSPFFITFEPLPAVKQGSGFTVSTNFLLYDLEVPRNLCTTVITQNCVEKLRYEVPVTLNAIINEIQVSDTGTITVDLTEELIDPILVILLATFAIPVVGIIIQRARGRSSFIPARRALGT